MTKESAETLNNLFEQFTTRKIERFQVILYIKVACIFVMLITISITMVIIHIRLLNIFKEIVILFGYLTPAELKFMLAKLKSFQKDSLRTTYVENSEDEMEADSKGLVTSA